MLVHADGVFLQILEGHPDEIDCLMAAIRKDPRHQEMRVISDRTVRRRGFREWTMAFRDAPREHLAAFEPYFPRGGALDGVESGLARRLLSAFLALHD